MATGGLLFACGEAPPEPASRTHVQPLTIQEVDGAFVTPASFLEAPGQGGLSWSYTFQDPGPGWETDAYVPSGWPTASGGFTYGGNQPGDHPTTAWPESASTLWARATFTLTAAEIDDLMLWARWDDEISIFINGKPAANLSNWASTYRYVGLSQEARGALRVGQNNIAVRVEDTGGGKYMDVGLTLSPEMADLPVEGEAPAAFDAITEFVRKEMSEHGVPAGAVAIGVGVHEDARIVLSQGFGYMDKQFSRPVPHDAVFRLASLDKPITEDVVRSLIAENRTIANTNEELELSTSVLSVFDAYGIVPVGPVDEEMDDVTIQHLLDHSGGIGELPGEEDLDEFYADLGVAPGTSTREDNIRWILGQPLLWTPGSPTVSDPYSSAGYMMLRYVVQLMTGDLLGYIQNDFLAPTEFSDIFIAAERLENRAKYTDGTLREPWYAHFYEPRDLWVYFENYTGLSGSAEAFVSYLQHYRGGGVSYGGLPSVQTVGGQFPHEGKTISYAAFFNLSGQLRFAKYENNVEIEPHFDGTLRQMIRDLPASAWEEPSDPGQGSVSCTMSGTRHWSSGFETTLTVQNITAAPARGWQVRMDFNQQVSMFGNGEVSPTYDGSSVTLTQQWYRPPLAPGASVTFTVGGNFPTPQPFVAPNCVGL